MNLKKSMISVATAAVLITGFAGCDTTATSTTASSNQTITNPKGSITGLVQDTNGNPIEGVTVMVANQTATTNAGGLYYFESVSVTDVAGTDAATAQQALSLTIMAPEGYLGATVTVKPEATIDSAENNGTLTGTETFVDGFLAQAGTAVLPSLTASVSGRLQDTTTGTNVGDTTITVDFVNTLTAAAQQVQNGVATTYATKTYSAEVAADGTFTLSGLPSDSLVTFAVSGYNVNATENDTNGGAADDFTTNGETGVVSLGDISLTPVVLGDEIRPTIDVKKSVSTSNELASGIDGVVKAIAIKFTEPMDTTKFNIDNLIVASKTGDVTDILALDTTKTTFDSTGTILSIYTQDAIGAGVELAVRFKKDELVDIAGNNLVDASTDASVADTLNEDDAATDRVDQLVGTAASYIELRIKTYGQPATLTTTVEDMKQADNVAITLDGTNYETKSFQGLNSDHNATYQFNPGANEANLTSLYNALSTDTDIDAGNFNLDAVTVNFTNDPAIATYVINVKSASTAVTSKSFDYNDNTINDTNLSTAAREITDTDREKGIIELRNIASAKVGDIVEIYPKNGFGDLGTPTRISLVDNTPLTTVLQNNNTVDGTTTNSTGAAAEPIKIGITASGTYMPNFEIDKDSLQSEDHTKSFSELLKNSTTTSAYNGLITANSVSSFNPTKTLGVKVSEKVGSTDAEILAASKVVGSTSEYNSSITAGTYTKIGNEFYLALTVDNTLNLQHADSITMKGVKDLNGNANDSDTMGVKIVDKLAPIMTSAVANGNTATFTFNEALATTETNVATYSPIVIDGKLEVKYNATADKLEVTNFVAYTDSTQASAQNDKDVTAANVKITATLSDDKKTVTLVASDNTPNRTDDTKSTLSNFFSFITYLSDKGNIKDENYLVTNAQVSFDGNASIANGATDVLLNIDTNSSTFANFVITDSTLPAIADGYIQNPTANSSDQVALAIVSENNATSAINVLDVNGTIWNTTDANVSVNDTLVIKFNEDVISDVNDDGVIDKKDIVGITYDLFDAAGTDSNYLKGDVDTNGSSNILKFTIVDHNVTNRAGDYITIKGVKDLAGNTMGDIQIKLNAHKAGVTVSTNAIN